MRVKSLKDTLTIFKEKILGLECEDAHARVVYHRYDGIVLNTTLVSFSEKRRVLSTVDGIKQVKNVANVYLPKSLSNSIMTIQKYDKFIRRLPTTLGLRRSDTIFLSTGVNMENVAFRKESYGDFQVCCIATGGALDNALRTGEDEGKWIEKEAGFQPKPGTINMILLTNASLTWGAMARAIITATEAKTAALQDLKYRSTASPKIQATGTGTDSMIVVSGVNPDLVIRHTGGHTKMGELIGFASKKAVTEALMKYDRNRSEVHWK
jgi:adenosylcobinamide hydrolase